MSEKKVEWKTLGRTLLTDQMIKARQKAARAWAWRVFKPEIDLDTCISCWTCVNYCPDGCIEKTDDGPVIDYNVCKGCGICPTECPVNAISFEREVR
jgi:pyruvate ferredoxin oxidoreductase delta subunit